MNKTAVLLAWFAVPLGAAGGYYGGKWQSPEIRQETNPKIPVPSVATHPDTKSVVTGWTAQLEKCSAADLPAFFSEMGKLPDSAAKTTALRLLCARWAEVDAAGGVAFFTTVKEEVASSPAALLKIWTDYGLPLPPPEAPLVRFSTGVRSVEKDGSETPHFSFGFLIGEQGEKKGVILAGFTRRDAQQGDGDIVEKIKPDATAITERHISAELDISGPNSLLGTAVQCEARGWTDFARELLARALLQDACHPFSPTFQKAGAAAADAMYASVWQHLQNEAMSPGCDRAGLAAKMKRLLDSGHDLPRDGGKWLYGALSAAAQPGKGKPGTPEAMIDRLVDSRKGGGMGGNDPDAADPYYQLEAQGFAAVPALLDHLEDPRLTCGMTQGFNNFPSWPRRVGDLVSDLLQDLSGGELGADWLDRQKGGGVVAETARVWWKKAQAAGEETWLVQGAVAKENKDRSFPNVCHLRILKARYPQRLADVLRSQMKRRPKAQIHPVITAIGESTLPVPEKIALLKLAAVQKNPETRRAALMSLSKHDLPYFNVAAIKAFDGMAKDTNEAYWASPESSLSHLALRTDDAAVWAAFLRAAKRAVTGLRMELMNPLNYGYVGESHKLQRLAFLAAFLDDTALRLLPKGEDEGKFSGPCAAFTIPRLRVCDFAAMQAASILGWPDRPDKKWTEAQWDGLVARVQAALSK